MAGSNTGKDDTLWRTVQSVIADRAAAALRASDPSSHDLDLLAEALEKGAHHPEMADALIAAGRAAEERDAARAEVERLREQFQAETLRTSELHRALEDLVNRHCDAHWDTPHPKMCETCRMLVEARAVLAKPVNAGRAVGVGEEGE